MRAATCSCGVLSVRCFSEPSKISQCLCLDCQRRTRSAFGVAAFSYQHDVAVTGQSEMYRRVADSGHSVTFRFCPNCGSMVFWHPSRLPDLVAVVVDAFADPEFPPPTQSVWNERRHRWLPTTFPAKA
ncbi:MAG: aldehyde-activating protein [Rhodospirillaceae bacterium]|nr:aldehyde-activating protein [Rhodospirillaceae bacterium]|tara:strand:+ start:11087 stop:11470 length:384 start_codon:yes stop_codon:yes gene_type:complete